MRIFYFFVLIYLLIIVNIGNSRIWQNEIIKSNIAGPWSRAGDFNNDGKQDILIQDEDSLLWYENHQQGWIKHIIGSDFHNNGFAWIEIFDMDNDNDSDILQYPMVNPDSIVWLENQSDGLLWKKHIIANNINEPFNFANSYGDIDHDNDMDLGLVSWGDSTVILFQNVFGDTVWKKHQIAKLASNPSWGAFVDLDSDNDLDFLVAQYISGEISWFENNLPDSTWIKHDVTSPPWSIPGTFVGKLIDMDNNGLVDIVTHSNQSDILIWFENPSWSGHIIASGVSGMFSGPIADIDLDGDLDVTFGGQSKMGWCENLGESNNWNIIVIDSVHNMFPSPVDFADIDADGYVDLTAYTTDGFGNGFGDARWYKNPLPEAQKIRVPEDYSSIQEGINAASDGDTVLVSDSTYYENINFKGKAITVASHFIVDGDTNHINNTIINGSQPNNSDSGSVVYFISGEDTNSVLIGFTISGGSGTLGSNNNRDGGGIYCLSGATIKNNKIMNNAINFTGYVTGGGIFAGFWTPDYIHIDHNVISNNTVESLQMWGGGIWFGVNGRIIGNKIENNVIIAESGWAVGAGISCQAPDTGNHAVQITDNIIRNNLCENNSTTSGVTGGALDLFYTDLIFENNFISENTVSSPYSCYGPAVRLVFTQNAELKNNKFYYNEGMGNNSIYSGALFLVSNTGTLVKNNEFFGNSGTWGGGIYVNNSNPIIQNNLIVNNNATYGGGIRVFTPTDEVNYEDLDKEIYYGGFNKTFGEKSKILNVESSLIKIVSQPQIINNTLKGNNAVSLGGGIYSTNSQTTILNSILWGNTAASGSQIHMSSGSLDVSYSDVEGGWIGTGNIDADPLFADTVSYYLTPSSPAVDAGNPDSVYYDPENPNNPGFAHSPSHGTITNDMGAYGGPGVIPDDSIFVAISDELLPSIPEKITLLQNYPNPFNPRTTIEFRLSKTEFVELKIYDILGKEVTTLVSDQLSAGEYRYNWQASKYSSGVYFYSLRTESGLKSIQKMLLIK